MSKLKAFEISISWFLSLFEKLLLLAKIHLVLRMLKEWGFQNLGTNEARSTVYVDTFHMMSKRSGASKLRSQIVSLLKQRHFWGFSEKWDDLCQKNWRLQTAKFKSKFIHRSIKVCFICAKNFSFLECFWSHDHEFFFLTISGNQKFTANLTCG